MLEKDTSVRNRYECRNTVHYKNHAKFLANCQLPTQVVPSGFAWGPPNQKIFFEPTFDISRIEAPIWSGLFNVTFAGVM